MNEVSVAARITDDIFTTGELGKDIKEQSLLIRSAKGNVLITGCSHPGLNMIMEKALELGEVYGIIGGFHGFDEYLLLEGLELIVSCHCTRHKKEIKRRYSENCEIGYAGKIIEICMLTCGIHKYYVIR